MTWKEFRLRLLSVGWTAKEADKEIKRLKNLEHDD